MCITAHQARGTRQQETGRVPRSLISHPGQNGQSGYHAQSRPRMHACTHARVHMHARMHMPMHAPCMHHVSICTVCTMYARMHHMHAPHMHMHVYACMHACMHACVHACMHRHAYARMHAYPPMHMHACMHECICMQFQIKQYPGAFHNEATPCTGYEGEHARRNILFVDL